MSIIGASTNDKIEMPRESLGNQIGKNRSKVVKTNLAHGIHLPKHLSVSSPAQL
jgi:hypothetical protein